jgi:heme exporter protein D
MIWHSAGEFFAMGGYAFYVWGSVAVCALGLGAELGALRLRRRQALARVRRRLRADALDALDPLDSADTAQALA